MSKCKSSEIKKTGIKHNDNKSLMTCYIVFMKSGQIQDTQILHMNHQKSQRKKKEKRVKNNEILLQSKK